jgi:hypothetical protein
MPFTYPIADTSMQPAAARGRGRGRGANIPPPQQGNEGAQQPGGQQAQNVQAVAVGAAGVLGVAAGMVQIVIDQDFLDALMRFQFSPAAIQAIATHGLTSVEQLIGLTPKDIENIMTIVRKSVPPIVVNYLSQKKLSIMTYWANKLHRLDEEIDAAAFTPAEIEKYGTMMNSEPDKDTVVKEPQEFKGNVKWKPWKEAVISYFNSVLTKDLIPLSYILREQENPTQGAQYESDHQRLVAIAPLRGNEFKHDNGIVFDFLKTWTINGPAYPWMKQYSVTRNSRASWLALLAYYEGTAARDRVKEAAYAAIVNVKYHSARKKFSFETYINIHQEAYQDLRQNDEIIPEDKCVRDLLMGIRDQSLNAAKQTIMAIQDLRGDFAATVAHLATTIQMNAAITPDNRNISGVASNKGAEGGGRGGRGRGRGGRGRGRGRGGRNIYLGTYSPDQWRALSQEDRKRVNEGRKRSAEQQQQGAVNISQVVTTQGQDQDNHSVITSGTAGASTAPS